MQRPLTVIQALQGDRIGRGLQIPSLDRKREWPFEPSAGLAIGADVKGGMVLGYVPENSQHSPQESSCHRACTAR